MIMLEDVLDIIRPKNWLKIENLKLEKMDVKFPYFWSIARAWRIFNLLVNGSIGIAESRKNIEKNERPARPEADRIRAPQFRTRSSLSCCEKADRLESQVMRTNPICTAGSAVFSPDESRRCNAITERPAHRNTVAHLRRADPADLVRAVHSAGRKWTRRRRSRRGAGGGAGQRRMRMSMKRRTMRWMRRRGGGGELEEEVEQEWVGVVEVDGHGEDGWEEDDEEEDEEREEEGRGGVGGEEDDEVDDEEGEGMGMGRTGGRGRRWRRRRRRRRRRSLVSVIRDKMEGIKMVCEPRSSPTSPGGKHLKWCDPPTSLRLTTSAPHFILITRRPTLAPAVSYLTPLLKQERLPYKIQNTCIGLFRSGGTFCQHYRGKFNPNFQSNHYFLTSTKVITATKVLSISTEIFEDPISTSLASNLEEHWN
ncbi:unnamed protein product [Nesidiocoris tenuis]|uniref:Uncharacterized protein n=1 Tax=Nesidiocoris tenuis TaxID=355587 RepID=A0A6H5HV55_9HEMI|nr:unnamed protein product [Nesidiocoris tenuis]